MNGGEAIPSGEPAVTRRWRDATPRLLSVLRIIAAFLFIEYGTAKLFGWPHALMPNGATAKVASLVWVAGILESFGGALLLGLFTRPLAFLVAGEMAVAYFKSHAGNGFWPVFNQGEPAVMFCFVWLYISSAGPGPWSLDAWLRRTEAP